MAGRVEEALTGGVDWLVALIGRAADSFEESAPLVAQDITVAHIGNHRVQLIEVDNKLKGACPFHDPAIFLEWASVTGYPNRMPSFIVDKDIEQYRCFACGMRGAVDSIKFGGGNGKQKG